METNFFRLIAKMDISGELHLVISKTEGNMLVVSTMLQNKKCTDRAKNFITPFNLRGTAEQVDIGYFGKIYQPMKEVSELLTNMESFKQQVEQARKQSSMAKETTERETKAEDLKEKKYREAMQKADDLEKEGKYREAWMSVPEPSTYPDRIEILRARREKLSAKFAPDLFATNTPKAEPTSQDSNLFPDRITNIANGEMEISDDEENDLQY